MNEPLAKVTVNQRRDRIFIIPCFQSTDGPYVDKEPVTESPSNAPFAIGVLVLEGLDRFEKGLPLPDWNCYSPVGLSNAGVKTWSDYLLGLKSCRVERHWHSFLIYPKENRGAKDGLVDIEGTRMTVAASATPQELGEAVLEALKTAK